MTQEWFFYLVRCRDDSLYSGITTDIEKRLREHNKGTGARYTSARRPVTLVYCEKHNNVSKARKRESQIKRWPKAKKERLVQELALSEYDLSKFFPRLRLRQAKSTLSVLDQKL